MKKLAQNLALVIGSILFTVLLAEGLVRLFVPRERWEFRDASADWEADSVRGWKQKANYSTTNHDFGPLPVVFQTNGDGFRPAVISSADIDTADFVILLVGNSTVNGRAVPANQTLHFFLDSLLRPSQPRVIVVNASVQGYSTDQALLVVRQYAQRYHADWVIYGFCDNDLGGNVSSQAYGLSKPRFQVVDDSLQFIPPPSFNSDLTSFRKASWKDLIVKSAVFRMFRPIVITMRARNQDPATQILIGAFSADYYYDPAQLETFDWKLLGRMLDELNHDADAIGARFAFYAHPAVESVWRIHAEAAESKTGKKIHPFALEEKLAQAGTQAVQFIPMAQVFLDNQSRGPFHLLPGDTHCNGAGYQLQAEILRDFIQGHSLR
jgi:lysophospholipase L1-like esterase